MIKINGRTFLQARDLKVGQGPGEAYTRKGGEILFGEVLRVRQDSGGVNAVVCLAGRPATPGNSSNLAGRTKIVLFPVGPVLA